MAVGEALCGGDPCGLGGTGTGTGRDGQVELGWGWGAPLGGAVLLRGGES